MNVSLVLVSLATFITGSLGHLNMLYPGVPGFPENHCHQDDCLRNVNATHHGPAVRKNRAEDCKSMMMVTETPVPVTVTSTYYTEVPTITVTTTQIPPPVTITSILTAPCSTPTPTMTEVPATATFETTACPPQTTTTTLIQTRNTKTVTEKCAISTCPPRNPPGYTLTLTSTTTATLPTCTLSPTPNEKRDVDPDPTITPAPDMNRVPSYAQKACPQGFPEYSSACACVVKTTPTTSLPPATKTQWVVQGEGRFGPV